MRETEHFVNEGYGWECRRCRASDAESAASDAGAVTPDREEKSPAALPRFFREGEAEAREPVLSTRALARRRDTPHGRALVCPRCDAEEVLSEQ